MSEMTLEQVRELADAVSRCSSPENVSRFNQAAGRWMYLNLDAIDAHLTRAPGQVTDEMVNRAIEAFENCRGTGEMGMRAAIESARLAQPVVAVDLPEEPVRMRHEWSTAKLGECVSCGQRRHGVIVDGELTCASCIDARRLDEWQSYAFKLRKLLDATSQCQPQGAQCDACGGVGYVTRVSGNHTCWKCGPSQGAQGEAVVFNQDGPIPEGFLLQVVSKTRLPEGTKLYTHAAERAAVPEGWVFFYADDEGVPWAAYCATRDDVYKQVASWMTGDFNGKAESDFGDDMIAGVTDTLIESGQFYPEGDPPCFLRKASAAPTLAGKDGA